MRTKRDVIAFFSRKLTRAEPAEISFFQNEVAMRDGSSAVPREEDAVPKRASSVVAIYVVVVAFMGLSLGDSRMSSKEDLSCEAIFSAARLAHPPSCQQDGQVRALGMPMTSPA